MISAVRSQKRANGGQCYCLPLQQYCCGSRLPTGQRELQPDRASDIVAEAASESAQRLGSDATPADPSDVHAQGVLQELAQTSAQDPVTDPAEATPLIHELKSHDQLGAARGLSDGAAHREDRVAALDDFSASNAPTTAMPETAVLKMNHPSSTRWESAVQADDESVENVVGNVTDDGLAEAAPQSFSLSLSADGQVGDAVAGAECSRGSALKSSSSRPFNRRPSAKTIDPRSCLVSLWQFGSERCLSIQFSLSSTAGDQ